jgi:hypothetical protein
MTDAYKENGYKDRKDYLIQLAANMGISEDIVLSIADMLGPNEDFDGLVNILEDL